MSKLKNDLYQAPNDEKTDYLLVVTISFFNIDTPT